MCMCPRDYIDSGREGNSLGRDHVHVAYSDLAKVRAGRVRKAVIQAEKRLGFKAEGGSFEGEHKVYEVEGLANKILEEGGE